MQQKEFEALTGKKVTTEEYADIEKIYMAIENMDKQEFCAAWKAGCFFYIMDEMVKRVQALEEVRDCMKKELDAANEKVEAAARMLLNKAGKYGDSDLKAAAINLVGLRQVVLIDVKMGYRLSETEREYILKNL